MSGNKQTKFNKILAKWTPLELQKLTECLRRTMQFDTTILAKHLQTKTTEEISKLLNCLSSSYSGDPSKLLYNENSTLEFALSLFQDITPQSINSSPVIAQAFEECSQYYDSLLSKSPSTSQVKPVQKITAKEALSQSALTNAYVSELYQFMSSLLRGDQGPVLGDVPAAIMLMVLDELAASLGTGSNSLYASQSDCLERFEEQIQCVQKNLGDMLALGMKSPDVSRAEQTALWSHLLKELHLLPDSEMDNTTEMEGKNLLLRNRTVCIASLNPLDVPPELSAPLDKIIHDKLTSNSLSKIIKPPLRFDCKPSVRKSPGKSFLKKLRDVTAETPAVLPEENIEKIIENKMKVTYLETSGVQKKSNPRKRAVNSLKKITSPPKLKFRKITDPVEGKSVDDLVKKTQVAFEHSSDDSNSSQASESTNT